MPDDAVTENGFVLGQRVDVIDYVGVVERVIEWAKARSPRYVCISNVHMVMEGHDDGSFQSVVNAADLVTADGKPLVWALKLLGNPTATQVRGPELMPRLLAAAAEHGIPVGFFGATNETLQLLADKVLQRYPALHIAYSYSPPFRALSETEDASIVEAIRASGARIIFVGLGCPKQERWMAKHCSSIDAVLVGTGAAFDFLAGTKLEAPEWVRELSLEWLFRLATEPRRLWKRYLRQNPRFLYLLGRDLVSDSRRNPTTS